MRDILLFCIVAPGCLISLRYPFVGAMLWTWISVMSPHRLAYGFMFDAPVAAAIAICILIGMWGTSEKRSPFVGAPVVWLVIFVCWMCLTTAFAFNPEGSFATLKKILKIDLMVLVVLMLIRSKREMICFAWVLALSMAFYGIKGGLFTLMTGGGDRVWGPPGTYIEENNALAVALIITVPLLRFLQTTLEKTWHKHVMTVIMLLCGVSILGSHSRGALLAISTMLVVLWWRGKNKIVTGFIMVVVGAAALSFMPQEWWDRMNTIQTHDDQSAMGRLNAWWMTFNLALDNPLGGGFSIYNAGIFAKYAPDPTFVVSAHSIYFNVLGEHGFVGLFIYLSIWLSTWMTGGWLRKQGRKNPEAEWCAQLGAMIQVSVAGFAVGGAFLSLAYFDLTYNLMILAVAAKHWVKTKGWEREVTFTPLRKVLGVPVLLGDRLTPRSI